MAFPIFSVPWEKAQNFAIAFLALVVLKLAYNLWNRNAISRLPYPPGPKPKFLIGNALDFPKGNASRVFAEWGKKYNSNILYAAAFGNHVVVINDLKTAEDVLENRAQLYSDRPDIPIVKVFGWEKHIALLRYNDVWREYRKICWQIFRPNAARRYHPIEQQCVHSFLRGVLHEPEKLFDYNTLMSISLAMKTMYGYSPEALDDPIIHSADESARLAGTLCELGGTLINVLPVLRYIPSWVPGTTGKRMGERVRELTEETRRIPMQRVAAEMKAGTASSAFVTDFLERMAAGGGSEKELAAVKDVAWTVYGTASDTTVAAAGIFLYLIAKHTRVQRKAQEEIDRVIGPSRLPNINDRPDLPYIEAIYRELMRYEPALGLGIPHALVEDDVIDGYFIPKGTVVSANIWAMTHDENRYPDPFAFKPERFIDADGKLNKDDRILAYGFGRRICVGKAVASDTMWLIIASFIACFNIGKARDEFGNEIEIDDTMAEYGLIIHKKPFKCSITPRSAKIQDLLECTAHQ